MDLILAGKRFTLNNDARFDMGDLPEVAKIKADRIQRKMGKNLQQRVNEESERIKQQQENDKKKLKYVDVGVPRYYKAQKME